MKKRELKNRINELETAYAIQQNEVNQLLRKLKKSEERNLRIIQKYDEASEKLEKVDKEVWIEKNEKQRLIYNINLLQKQLDDIAKRLNRLGYGENPNKYVISK